MNDVEIRVAIAEAMGASDCSSQMAWWPPECREMLCRLCCRPIESEERKPELLADLPDFPNDLYAMHEAEKSLDTIDKWQTYIRELGKLTLRNTTWFEVANNASEIGVIHSIAPVFSATARQRCEAFLRTFGKWQE